LDNIYNGHLVGPEQLRDLSSKGLLSASSFKNGHFLTKAGVRSRGGEHFHEVIPTAKARTAEATTFVWDKLWEDVTKVSKVR
tara:strand:- start:32 stop:277 length:246 start_codon:yes stop_codon:yes gene_type:complete